MSLEPFASSAAPTDADDSALDGSEGQTYVVFTVDDRGYALPVERVQAARPLPAVTRLPTLAPHVLGLFHHRGTVLPLWDLHTLLAADGAPPRHPHVLVVEQDRQVVGIVVQHVDEVITTAQTDVVPADASGLPGHLEEVVAGRLRVPEAPVLAPQDDADAGAVPGREQTGPDPQDAGRGRDARAAAVLERLDPVHLIDGARLFESGCGRRPTRGQEATHGRP